MEHSSAAVGLFICCVVVGDWGGQSGCGTGFSSDTSPSSVGTFHQYVFVHRVVCRQWVVRGGGFTQPAYGLSVCHSQTMNTRSHVSDADIIKKGVTRKVLEKTAALGVHVEVAR